MSHRFFVETRINGEFATLTGQEAQHLSKVMRGSVGDQVTLFDGSGDEFLAEITTIRRSEVDLRIQERSSISRELPFQVTVAVSLPKGDRQKWLIEKLTELGVTHFVPLITARGVAQPESQAIARLNRAVIEASKQCGRNRLMQITGPVACSELIKARMDALRFFAHPNGEELRTINIRNGRDVVLAVGPEGGFSDDELAAAEQAGWTTVSLGPRILRIETAAVALTAAVTL